jgi:ribonuclease HII
MAVPDKLWHHPTDADAYDLWIGVDEAGRGPLAGPVVASAVLLKKNSFRTVIRDSKKVSARQRDAAFCEICENAHIGIGIISERVVETVNILEATYYAMNRAVAQLVRKLPDAVKNRDNFSEKICLLVDGNRYKSYLPYAYRTVIAGDTFVFPISCASIIAKVTRDRILNMYDQIYPQYGFKSNKGYPTKKHKQAIVEHGLSLLHRKTFNHA